MVRSDVDGLLTFLRRNLAGKFSENPEQIQRLANSTFRSGMDHAPFAFVEPDDVAQLRLTVQAALDHSVQLAVQATGHGSPRIGNETLLISVRKLKGIEVDARLGIARVQPGVTAGEFLKATAPYGLAPVVGASPSVSYTGLVLGGGISPMGRTFGYACDSVRSMEVATTRGCMSVGADEQDLFWALRGGRGNFGVTVSTQVSLHRIDTFLGGCLWFDVANAGDILSIYREFTDRVSQRTTTSLAMLRWPSLASRAGKSDDVVVALRVVHLGDREELDAILRPFTALGPLADSIGAMSPADIGQVHNDPATPGRYMDRSTMDRSISSGVTDIWSVAPAALVAGLSGVVEIRHLAGAFSRPLFEPAAVHRWPAFSIFVGGLTGEASVDAVGQFQESVIAAVNSGTGPCPSLMGADEATPDLVASAFGEMLPRLKQVKSHWDPSNFFRGNHNITPAS